MTGDGRLLAKDRVVQNLRESICNRIMPFAQLLTKNVELHAQEMPRSSVGINSITSFGTANRARTSDSMTADTATIRWTN